MSKLSENIVKYRKKKNFSQEKLAELLDISRQAVTKWESGNGNPSTDNLFRLSEILDVSIEELVGDHCPSSKDAIVGKGIWFLLIISISVFVLNLFIGIVDNTFEASNIIINFIVLVPIQLFITLFFTNAIKNKNYVGIAGYDEKIKYDEYQLQTMLIKILYLINSSSTTFICLSTILNKTEIYYFQKYLFIIYFIKFILGIIFINWKFYSKVFIHELDRYKAYIGLRSVFIYFFTLIFTMINLILVIYFKKIENNTIEAFKVLIPFLISIIIQLIGLLLNNTRIKNIKKIDDKYKLKYLLYVLSLGISLLVWIV